MAIGIYIHIPFCIRKCPYCDFYSLSGEEYRDDYVASLMNQIRIFAGAQVDSIYFGGGTPSLLSEEQLASIMGCLNESFSLSDDCETTLECNPASAERTKLSAFRRLGINRLSIGVQRLDDRLLLRLGRLHDTAGAQKTLDDALGIFDNVSADLMLGIPDDSIDSVFKSIRLLANCGVSHISAYLLKLMESTPFGESPPGGIPNDDEQADIYRAAVGELAKLGFARYEISNFAKKGFESRHNLKYWNGADWLGFGAAAHSSIAGTRYSFARDINKYINTYKNPQMADKLAPLSIEGVVDGEEYLMMRLRTEEGLSLSELERRFHTRLDGKKLRFVEDCKRAGLCVFDGEILRLTTDGMLVSNELISRLI